MRPVPWAAALVVFVTSVVHAQGSGPVEPMVYVTDAVGDVIARSSQGNASMPVQAHPHVDLREFWVANETEDSFEVGFRLERWEDPLQEQETVGRFVQVGFSFLRGFYTAQFGPGLDGSPCPPDQGVMIAQEFERGPGPSRYSIGHTCLNVTTEPSRAIARMEIPKNAIESHNGLPLQLGDSITNFAARAQQLFGYGTAYDRAPDEGFAPPTILRRGSTSEATTLGLFSKVPIRASNGESTTMVFEVRLANGDGKDHVVTLVADESNPDWAIRLPRELRVAAHGTTDFPVILSMNFTHDHGDTELFAVRASTISDPPETAEIELGVHWLEIPQPAGHHDRLWLHSGPPRPDLVVPGEVLNVVRPWMNALEDDPRSDTEPPIYGRSYYPCSHPDFGGCGTDTRVWWEIPLDPTLEIGLDFDESRQGIVEARIRPTFPATSAVLNATLFFCDSNVTTDYRDRLCGYEARVDLLSGESTPMALSSNTERTFTVPLMVNTSEGLVPFSPGRNLELDFVLTSDLPQGVDPLLREPTAALLPVGSIVMLPLFEYHDPIDKAFLQVGSIELRALDVHEKRLNPGRGAVFRYDLVNSGSVQQRLGLGVEGINREWASIHEGDEIVVGPSDTKQVSVIVRAPDDAIEGERAELFLVAQSVNDPSLMTLARIRASVVDLGTQDVPDEATSLSPIVSNERTPSASMAWVVAALFVAFALRFRRVN